MMREINPFDEDFVVSLTLKKYVDFAIVSVFHFMTFNHNRRNFGKIQYMKNFIT